MKKTVSFFENILYWLWLYTQRMGIGLPFKSALFFLFALALSNLMSVAIISYLAYTVLCDAMDIPYVLLDREKNAVIFLLLFLPTLFYFQVRYRGGKYCKKKRQRFWWDNGKYCILMDYFDKLTQTQKQKYRKTFFIY